MKRDGLLILDVDGISIALQRVRNDVTIYVTEPEISISVDSAKLLIAALTFLADEEEETEQ